MNWVAPTEVTKGQVAGNEAWKRTHRSQPVPESPEAKMMDTPRAPSFWN